MENEDFFFHTNIIYTTAVLLSLWSLRRSLLSTVVNQRSQDHEPIKSYCAKQKNATPNLPQKWKRKPPFFFFSISLLLNRPPPPSSQSHSFCSISFLLLFNLISSFSQSHSFISVSLLLLFSLTLPSPYKAVWLASLTGTRVYGDRPI